DDELLRQALGIVGNAGVVLDDQVDLLAGDGRAVLVHIGLDAGLNLLANRREPAGERQHQTDLGRVLGQRAGGRECAGGKRNSNLTQHELCSPLVRWAAIYSGSGSGSWPKRMNFRK